MTVFFSNLSKTDSARDEPKQPTSKPQRAPKAAAELAYT
jgi:hypothetical protein